MSTNRSQWVKAAKSGPDSNCVEMRAPSKVAVEVRDTKAKGAGPTLQLAPGAFATWIAAACSGELDHLA